MLILYDDCPYYLRVSLAQLVSSVGKRVGLGNFERAG